MGLKISRAKAIIFLVSISFMIGLPLSYVAQKVIQYKTYIWMPTYVLDSRSNNLDKIHNGHVLFMIADHHEPGKGERGSKSSARWCNRYEDIIEGVKDDFGNSFQYTWFYPYDHFNSQVLFNLNDLVFAGLGEVEFHWHHGNETNASFPPKLESALDWFNSHGCMLPIGRNPKPHFGFIHGNWALDNSVGDPDKCGVNKELDILKQYGCYADFTFSTLGTLAQPAKINSIYYANDTDAPKSYNEGIDAKVGSTNSGFMIFQGPICCDWHDLIWECGAFETTSPFKPHRIRLWLNYASTVKGRPEWLFVKIHTHGSQSRDVILSNQFRDMLSELKRICNENQLYLHFVTTREAYNIVKAAEQGHDGNPEIYRDYLLKKPINRVMSISCRIKNVVICKTKLQFELVQPQYSTFSFRIGPIIQIKGFLSKFQIGFRRQQYSGLVEGEGMIELTSKEEIQFENQVISHSLNPVGEHIYVLKAKHSH